MLANSDETQSTYFNPTKTELYELYGRDLDEKAGFLNSGELKENQKKFSRLKQKRACKSDSCLLTHEFITSQETSSESKRNSKGTLLLSQIQNDFQLYYVPPLQNT